MIKSKIHIHFEPMLGFNNISVPAIAAIEPEDGPNNERS